MESTERLAAHLGAAKRELGAALAEGECGTCADLLRQEIEHLDLFVEVVQKTDRLVSAQRPVTESFRTGVAAADAALRDSGAAPVTGDPGVGPAQFFRDFVRDRIRITDVLTFGRR